jgi:hypothetical protein
MAVLKTEGETTKRRGAQKSGYRQLHFLVDKTREYCELTFSECEANFASVTLEMRDLTSK